MYERPDLAPDERDVDSVLSAVPPVALPLGFRDGVMTRLRAERRVTWEWVVAILFAIPSVVYLARLAIVHGDDVVTAMNNIVAAASSQTTDAFFFIDGLAVLALALLGIACAFAAHALAVTGSGGTRLVR